MPIIEVVPDEQYAPAVSGDFWRNPTESRYSFSLRNGEIVVRVEPGSRRTLEDVAAQIVPGSVVAVSVPERDQYRSEHTVSADDVHIK